MNRITAEEFWKDRAKNKYLLAKENFTSLMFVVLIFLGLGWMLSQFDGNHFRNTIIPYFLFVGIGLAGIYTLRFHKNSILRVIVGHFYHALFFLYTGLYFLIIAFLFLMYSEVIIDKNIISLISITSITLMPVLVVFFLFTKPFLIKNELEEHKVNTLFLKFGFPFIGGGVGLGYSLIYIVEAYAGDFEAISSTTIALVPALMFFALFSYFFRRYCFYVFLVQIIRI